MEDLRAIFVKHAASQGALTSDKQLNKDQLKKLIWETGFDSVKDADVDALFKEIDRNQSGLLDVDEFMAYMYTGDKLNSDPNDPNGAKDRARDTLLRIRKAHMKLNSQQVIGTLRLIPKFSVLSFTQKYLEQTGNKYAASGKPD